MSDTGPLYDLSKRMVQRACRLLDSGHQLSPAWLVGQVNECRGHIPRWQDLTGNCPTERAYLMLADGDGVEVWLLFWPHDARIGFHDHGGSSGAFVVGHGNLVERYATAGAASVATRITHPGYSVAFDGHFIHNVTSPFGPTTSLHLYSPATRPVLDYEFDPTGGDLVARTAQPA